METHVSRPNGGKTKTVPARRIFFIRAVGARAYADRYGLVATAGSDSHRPGDEGISGILSETLPEDSFAFAKLIRSRNFTCIK